MPTSETPQILQQIVVAGRRLEFFWTRGRKGREPVLVFLHEGLGSARLWREFPTQVSALTGLPALVYSRYGYGGSDVLQEPRSVHYMHQEALGDLPELREILRLDDVILVGHSDCVYRLDPCRGRSVARAQPSSRGTPRDGGRRHH